MSSPIPPTSTKSTLPATQPVDTQPMRDDATDATVKTTNDVATAVVNKPLVTPILKKRKIVPFSQKLSEFWNRIVNFFKRCWDSDVSTYDTPSRDFVTEAMPMKRFDPFDLWPSANKPAVVIDSTPTSKSYSPPVAVDTPAKFRNELPGKLTELAKALNSQKATANKDFLLKPRGQANITGANCYMNASLQPLENCYLQYDVNCQQLIDKDLTILPNETLKQFEKRILHTWAPIEDSEDVDVNQLKAEVQGFKTSLSQLNAEQPIERRKINRSIERLENIIFRIEDQDEVDYNNRVIFKWSYLLILQAKKYGDLDQVEKALRRHHNATFMQNVPYMQFHERNAQLDASLYLMLWHERLGLGIYQSSSNESKKLDGESYLSASAPVDKMGIIKINLRNDQGVQAGSVVESIENYFSDQINNSIPKQILEANLISKNKQLEETSSINILKVNGLEKEIENIKKNLRNLSNWRPEDNLTFEDWTCKRLLIESPPQFLQIALDRFYAESNHPSSPRIKIKEKILFDLNSNDKFTDPFDFSKYFDPEVIPDGGAKYELIGISQHRGSSINGGHYVSYVKKGQQWFCANDSSISSVAVASVPFDDCSVLSYRRL